MDSERLARYLAGEASPSERSAVETWAADKPSNRAELARLEAAWQTDVPPGEWDVQAAWARVSTRLDDPTVSTDPDIVPITRRRFVPWLAAAAVLVAAGAGGLWTLRSGAAEYVTAVGQQQSITLADGSQVVLAPASRLVVEPRFGRPVRAVTLSGRAWFVVTHDSLHPFRVTTPDAVVEDLGTKFEIDTEAGAFKVTVAEGAVAIHRNGSESIHLAAGDMARLPAEGEPMVSHAIEVERMTSWRSGTLDFENRPLREVAAELSRWYDISFTLGPDVEQMRFSGTLPTDRLDQALNTIGTTFGDLSLTRSGRTVKLVSKVP